jgi:hypothetical protein
MGFITRFGFNGKPFLENCHTNSKVSSLFASNGVIDEIKIDETLDSENSIEQTPWTMDTGFLCHFLNSLEAGNLTNNGIKIQKIRFKRRKVGDLTWQTMIDYPFSDDIENYDTEDFYICAGYNYDYTLIPVVQNFEGVGVTSNITPMYKSLFLTGRNSSGDLVNYPLRFDLNLSDISLNEDKTVMKTLSSQYPAILCGGSKYMSGSLAFDIISPNCESNSGKIDMQAENAYRESFEEFIHTGKPMLVRTHSFYTLGVLSDIKKNPLFGDDAGWGLYKYTCTFTEIGNGKDMDTLQKNNLTYEITTS